MDQCFGEAKQLYYDNMAFARAMYFNNVPTARWIKTWEDALAMTLGHPAQGRQMIRHAFNAKTGMYPLNKDICIERIKERQLMRQNKIGTHDQLIPQVAATTDGRVLKEQKLMPRKRVANMEKQLEERFEDDEEEEEEERTAKKRQVNIGKFFGDGDSYYEKIALDDAAKEKEAAKKKEASVRKREAGKAKTARKQAERAEAHRREVAARKAAKQRKRQEKLEAAERAKARKERQKTVGSACMATPPKQKKSPPASPGNSPRSPWSKVAAKSTTKPP